MFNNDCGSGGNGTFAFCTGSFTKPPAVISNNSGELVLGLMVPDNAYGTGFFWDYSGSNTRNAMPPPAGYQDVLLQLTIGGVDDPGQFLFGWEDLNTGCTQRSEVNNDRFPEEQLGNGPMLDQLLRELHGDTAGRRHRQRLQRLVHAIRHLGRRYAARGRGAGTGDDVADGDRIAQLEWDLSPAPPARIA